MNPAFDTVDEETGKVYIDLLALPEGHPMRERKLTDLKAEYRHIMGWEWKPVVVGRSLDWNTVNTLDGAWVNFFKWRAPKENV